MLAAENESSADKPMVHQMEKMHSHMLTMQQQEKERMSCQQDDAQCQRMQTAEHRQEGMQERMGTMQMMMQQMLDHQSVRADQQ